MKLDEIKDWYQKKWCGKGTAAYQVDADRLEALLKDQYGLYVTMDPELEIDEEIKQHLTPYYVSMKDYAIIQGKSYETIKMYRHKFKSIALRKPSNCRPNRVIQTIDLCETYYTESQKFDAKMLQDFTKSYKNHKILDDIARYSQEKGISLMDAFELTLRTGIEILKEKDN